MIKKVYVVEDMAMSRAALISVLEDHDYEVVGSAAVADKAWMELKELKVDLVLIDVNLPGKLDGIWLGNKIRNELNLAIIYITAYGDDDTMQKINKLDPDGYIMKPYNSPTLLSAVNIALRFFTFKQTLKKGANNYKYIFIKYASIRVKIKVVDILFVESDKNYIFIFLKDKRYKVRQTITSFQEELNDTSFLRVHRSFVVNKDYIQGILPNSILIGDREIPISNSSKAILKDLYL